MSRFAIKVTGEIILDAMTETEAKDTAQSFLDKALSEATRDDIDRVWLDAEIDD